MDDDDSEFVLFTLVITVIHIYYVARYNKSIRNDSPGFGERYIRDLISQDHARRCQDVLRMPLDTFLSLHDWLIRHTELRGSDRGLSSLEKLAIFLRICGHGMAYRTAAECFRHSTDTISR